MDNVLVQSDGSMISSNEIPFTSETLVFTIPQRIIYTWNPNDPCFYWKAPFWGCFFSEKK